MTSTLWSSADRLQVPRASRLTEDADCVVRRERANLERLASALREVHARLRVARMSDEDAKALQVRVDGMMLETVGNSTGRPTRDHLTFWPI